MNEKTNGKIKNIIPGNTSPETRVILANALYFNAEWQETFIEGATGFKKFYPNGKDSDYSVMVELMAHGGEHCHEFLIKHRLMFKHLISPGKFPHYYDPESDCDILGLPYKQNATTFYVILPKNSNPERLKVAQKILTAEKIEKIISQMVIKTAVILFPKMHLACGHQLKSALQDLGLRTLFEPYTSDLTVMSDGKQHNIDRQSGLKEPQFPGFSSFSPQSYPASNTAKKPQRHGSSSTNPFTTTDRTEQLIFGRNGDDTDTESPKKRKRDVTYKAESEDSKRANPLTLKDFMNRKRIVKKSQGKKLRRSKRQFMPFAAERLDMIRNRKDLVNPRLFAEEVIHKVDLTVNEKGTEGGAATAITLNRSGSSVVLRVDTPFMFLIRHDPTHIPLFYGVVFEPVND